MKWFIVKITLLAYIASLVVFVFYFPEIQITDEERELNCRKKIDRIVNNYEFILNKTVENLTEKSQTDYTLSQVGPGKNFN